MYLYSFVFSCKILRVVAHNGPSFEWTYHEAVAREAGLTTAQLIIIRDVSKSLPSPSAPSPLTSLQAATLAFVDASTKDIKVPDAIFSALTAELRPLVGAGGVEDVQDLLVEVAAAVAIYNMASRFLTSTNISGLETDLIVPSPVDRTEVRPFILHR